MTNKSASMPRMAPLLRITANPVRVLVIAPENKRRAELATLLYDTGFDVEQANDTDTALAQLKKSWAEIVVFDLRSAIAQTDDVGVTVMREIATLQPRPGLIVFTADGSSQHERAALELGAVAVPRDGEDLEKLPDQVCEAWYRRQRAIDGC
jgi:DNA-binding NtrC family response regulator